MTNVSERGKNITKFTGNALYGMKKEYSEPQLHQWRLRRGGWLIMEWPNTVVAKCFENDTNINFHKACCFSVFRYFLSDVTIEY
jgi:hypothetical protein